VLELDRVGAVAVVTLATGKVNALDLELCHRLTSLFEQLADDPVAAVVLTGRGTAFSAGVDLRAMLDGGTDYVDAFLPALGAVALTLLAFPKPLVAAVNGHAIAGGCVLACAGDIRLMSGGRGRIGVSELYAGVSFPLAALECLRYAVGTARAADLVVTGAALSAVEALQAGLVHEVVEDDLLAQAVRRAERLSTEIPADAFAAAKRQLRRPHLEAVRAFAAADDARCAEVWRRRIADGWMEAFLARATGKH
jgi:enoyl-CoA hydratase